MHRVSSHSKIGKKELDKREATAVTISKNKETDSMREVSIKLLAMMRAKKECGII